MQAKQMKRKFLVINKQGQVFRQSDGPAIKVPSVKKLPGGQF